MAELEQILGHLRAWSWLWVIGGGVNIIGVIMIAMLYDRWNTKLEQAEKILTNVADYASLQRFLWNYDDLTLPVKEELYQRLRNDAGDFAKARSTLDKLFEKYKADPEIQEAATRRELRVK